MGAVLKFLQAARNLAKQGVKRDEILAFAKREFGEVTDYMKNAVDDIYSRYAASPLQKILEKRKAAKQSVDERKVLDMEGNVIDPNQPIIGGKQDKGIATLKTEFTPEQAADDIFHREITNMIWIWQLNLMLRIILKCLKTCFMKI